MDSTIVEDVRRHLQYLAGEIGNRPIGSDANQAAAAYIASAFTQAGLEVEFQEFPCPDWAEESTTLHLGDDSLEAYANTFSPSCDVLAPTLAIGTLAELEYAQIAGRIPIFYGDLTQNSLGAKGAIYISERDQKIVGLLEGRRPTALLTVNPNWHGRWRLIEDYDLPIASATVPPPVGLQLVRRAGETVRLRISTRSASSHSANVIGRLAGEHPERIVLCAHYDTKVDTPGAHDNAAGVAVILTLARLLAQEKRPLSLEWIAFSGEEVYGLGDMEYMRRIAGDFSNISAAINLDGVGPWLASNSLAVFAASDEFEALMQGIKEKYPAVVWVDPWPASDHYIFYSHGVPSLALGSVGTRDVFHTPRDTLETVSPAKLAEAACLARDIVLPLAEKKPGWGRVVPAARSG